jgi:hypothetical protein
MMAIVDALYKMSSRGIEDAVAISILPHEISRSARNGSKGQIASLTLACMKVLPLSRD